MICTCAEFGRLPTRPLLRVKRDGWGARWGRRAPDETRRRGPGDQSDVRGRSQHGVCPGRRPHHAGLATPGSAGEARRFRGVTARCGAAERHGSHCTAAATRSDPEPVSSRIFQIDFTDECYVFHVAWPRENTLPFDYVAPPEGGSGTLGLVVFGREGRGHLPAAGIGTCRTLEKRPSCYIEYAEALAETVYFPSFARSRFSYRRPQL